MHIKNKRRMNQIALAVGMALAAPVALAATVTPTQVPGQGFVAYSGGTAVAAATGAGTETITITSATSNTPVILQWGGTAPSSATLLNSTGTAGFNIGASASTTFAMASSGAAVLNIDVTNNPSQILGALSVTGSGAGVTNLFVANANGIVVGSTAVITAPGGLGLVNADLSSTQAQAVFTSDNVLPISFAGASGGVQILSGADMSGIGGGTLLVAGAGVVNVAGAQIGASSASHYAFSSSTALDINGGIGGYMDTATGSRFTPQDSGAAMTFGSLSTGNATSGFSYADAPGTAVSLNLGVTTAPFDAYALSVLANGSIANQGDLTNVSNSTFQWINGTLTNTGQIDFGNQGTSSALIPTTTTADLGFNSSSLYGNTSQAQSAGGFVNASAGLVNGGSFSFTGASFDNEGTIQMGQSSATYAPELSINAFTGNINLNGTLNVTGADSYTGANYLSYVGLFANTTAGQDINVGVPLTVAGNYYYGNDVTIDASGNIVTNQAISVSGSTYQNRVSMEAGYLTSGTLASSVANITVNSPVTVSGDNYYYNDIHLKAPGDVNINGALSATANGSARIIAEAGADNNGTFGPGALNVNAAVTVQAGGMSGASSNQYSNLGLFGATGVNINAPVSMSVLAGTGTTQVAMGNIYIDALQGSLITGSLGTVSATLMASGSYENTASLSSTVIAANDINLGAPLNLSVSASGGSHSNSASLTGIGIPVNGSGAITIGTAAPINVSVSATGTGSNSAEFSATNHYYNNVNNIVTGMDIYAPITVNVDASGSAYQNLANVSGFDLSGGMGSLLLASGAPLTVNVSAVSPSNAVSPDNTATFSGSIGAAQNVTLNSAVNINATATPSVVGTAEASAYLYAYATNMTINQSLDMDAASGYFDFYSTYGQNGATQQGTFSLASGAMLMAPNLDLGSVADPAATTYVFDGQVMASGNGSNNGYVTIGSTGAYVTNISGTGSIAAGYLTVNNLLGNFNNIQTGQILSNGFQLIAPSTEPMGISVSAVGNVAQGVNLAIDGSAVVDSGSTETVGTQTPAGNADATQYLYPANANSIFVAQATGDMTVNPGIGSPAYAVGNTGIGGFFQWPGLVYVKGDTGMTVNAAIANAFGSTAQTGREGVYIIGPSITMNQPVYTNTNAGVVFANADYGYTSINGNALGMNPVTVYFAQPQTLSVGGGNALFTMQPNGTFVNEKGYNQEMQTFLTLP